MHTVTVSKSYCIIIPETLRSSMAIKPGHKFKVIVYNGRIQLIPEQDALELRGVLREKNLEFNREDDWL